MRRPERDARATGGGHGALGTLLVLLTSVLAFGICVQGRAAENADTRFDYLLPITQACRLSLPTNFQHGGIITDARAAEITGHAGICVAGSYTVLGGVITVTVSAGEILPGRATPGTSVTVVGRTLTAVLPTPMRSDVALITYTVKRSGPYEVQVDTVVTGRAVPEAPFPVVTLGPGVSSGSYVGFQGAPLGAEGPGPTPPIILPPLEGESPADPAPASGTGTTEPAEGQAVGRPERSPFLVPSTTLGKCRLIAVAPRPPVVQSRRRLRIIAHGFPVAYESRGNCSRVGLTLQIRTPNGLVATKTVTFSSVPGYRLVVLKPTPKTARLLMSALPFHITGEVTGPGKREPARLPRTALEVTNPDDPKLSASIVEPMEVCASKGVPCQLAAVVSSRVSRDNDNLDWEDQAKVDFSPLKVGARFRWRQPAKGSGEARFAALRLCVHVSFVAKLSSKQGLSTAPLGGVPRMFPEGPMRQPFQTGRTVSFTGASCTPVEGDEGGGSHSVESDGARGEDAFVTGLPYAEVDSITVGVRAELQYSSRPTGKWEQIDKTRWASDTLVLD